MYMIKVCACYRPSSIQLLIAKHQNVVKFAIINAHLPSSDLKVSYDLYINRILRNAYYHIQHPYIIQSRLNFTILIGLQNKMMNDYEDTARTWTSKDIH